MAGMDKPTAGKVYFGDTRTDNLKEAALAEFRRGDVGFVFQQMHLVSNLSILENVTMPGYLLGKKSSREIERRAVELLALTGIQDLKDRLPSQVSGGQQQRAGIARALINQPALLFADEPTGALNSKTGREILDLLGQLNRNGQSILMVTHDLKAATRADRIIYLHDGQIAGELRLEQYTPDAAPEREQVALAWLTEKGW
jgi:putative ABC transport system ATP-binding protein